MKRLFLGLCLLTACGGGEVVAVSTPGSLTLTLHTPGLNDGALVLVVSGGPVNAVHGSGALDVVKQTDGSGTHLMFIGDLAEGVIATIDIPDIGTAKAYVATVVQVADRTNFSLLDSGPYQLIIAPVP